MSLTIIEDELLADKVKEYFSFSHSMSMSPQFYEKKLQ